MSELRKNRRDNNQCPYCGSNIDDPAFVYCSDCRILGEEQRKRRYLDKQSNGGTEQILIDLTQEQVREVRNKICYVDHCQKVADPGVGKCSTHRARWAEYARRNRQKRRDEARCTRCGSNLIDSKFTHCAKCRFKKDQDRLKRQDKCKSNGETQGQNKQAKNKCSKGGCSTLVVGPRSMCDIHRTQLSKKLAEKRKERRNNNECYVCGAKMDDTQFRRCENCRIKRQQTDKRTRAKHRATKQKKRVESYEDDTVKKECKKSGCSTLATKTLCPVHNLENTEHWAEIRRQRRESHECYACGSKIDDSQFKSCGNCRQKYQVRAKRAAERSTKKQNTCVETSSREQRISFVDFVCNPVDISNETHSDPMDIDPLPQVDEEAGVAEILQQMSEPRDNLQPSVGWNAINN